MTYSRTRTQTKAQRPTVGRIVHYVSHGTPVREDGSQAFESQCRAAIVTEVPETLPAWAEPFDGCANGYQGVWCVALAVLNPTGFFFTEDLRYDPSGEAGTWHWPERD